jgi:hypothetical protein
MALLLGSRAWCLTLPGASSGAQEKAKANAAQIEELSERVNALMLEKRQLERALERATSNNAQVRAFSIYSPKSPLKDA